MTFKVSDASLYQTQIQKDRAKNLMDKIQKKLTVIEFALDYQDSTELEELCKHLQTVLGELKI